MGHPMKIYCIAILCATYSTVWGQEGVVVSGKTSTGNNGSVSYSVGQVVSSSLSNATGSVNQGVQQAYDISVINGIKANKNGHKIDVSVYPNPTASSLNLAIKDSLLNHLSYQLYVFDGKLVKTATITAKETVIDMDNYAATTYILHVFEANTNISSFKIIKK